MQLMKLDNNNYSAKASKAAYQDACGMAHGLELLGDRWAWFVVRAREA